MTPLEHALAYAARGWRVFPAHNMVRGNCSCGRGDQCKSKGKHPRTRNGVKDATTNVDTITAWWTTWPDANIAIETGRASGIFAIDIDQRKNGFASFEKFEDDRGGPLPETLIALTGGGGRHLLFAYPSGGISGRNPWLPGVDVKSDGGYIIAEPSNHESGGSYTWLTSMDQTIVQAPLDVLQAIRTDDGGGKGDLPSAKSILDGIEEGKRDDVLFRWACRLRRQHSTDDDGGRAVIEKLVLDAAANCDPPFPRDEALRKVEQAFKQDHAGLSDSEQRWADFIAKGTASPAEKESRVRPGGAFILDEPEQIPAVWGDGERVLWAEGEGLMITGHQGVGKTTVAQQIVLHRLGIRDGGLFGLPVALGAGRVLYLAMDRPRQAARSFRRMVSEQDRDILDARLLVWRGPLPRSPLDRVTYLADLAEEICPGVDTVVIDSVKDLAPGISKDEVGAALNSAWQEIIARDMQLLLLHHERKAGSDAKRTHKLDDVYGSTWLTSGLGSVIVLNGDPGDPTIELQHLKQPADPLGPWTIRHDHTSGVSTVLQSLPTLAELLQTAGEAGVTAETVALTLYGRAGSAESQRTRRALNKLVSDGLANKEPGARTSAGSDPDRWFWSARARWAQGVNQWS